MCFVHTLSRERSIRPSIRGSDSRGCAGGDRDRLVLAPPLPAPRGAAAGIDLCSFRNF